MQNLDIILTNNSKTEDIAKKRLIEIVKKYDLSDHIYTNVLKIEDRAIPHSHPILTLNSFPYTDENIILDTFIHEQLHWKFENLDKSIFKKVISLLKEKYPDAPWGFPIGCIDQDSTYLHLILCHMTQKILIHFIGEEAAANVLYYQQNHHYIWVYNMIEVDSEYIDDLTKRFLG